MILSAEHTIIDLFYIFFECRKKENYYVKRTLKNEKLTEILTNYFNLEML
nr:MAG TPA: hypothetical protein [Caudoviricetes sp.]